MRIAHGDEIDEIRLPRPAVRFPIELRIPPSFDPADPSTYPKVEGRLEYVAGRLLYMPPTGDIQSDVVPSLVHVLMSWALEHPDFIVASSEAGMILGGETRGADGAIWRRADVGPRTGHFRRTPPLLAVEIAGEDDDELSLREKAAWYLDHGVEIVWNVLPETFEVVVVTREGETRHGLGSTLPAIDALPGLTPAVDGLFAQLLRP